MARRPFWRAAISCFLPAMCRMRCVRCRIRLYWSPSCSTIAAGRHNKPTDQLKDKHGAKIVDVGTCRTAHHQVVQGAEESITVVVVEQRSCAHAFRFGTSKRVRLIE